MPEPIATWNPARDAWEMGQVMFCGHSAVFSAIWPTAGTTRDGVAYPRPPLVLPTPGIARSLLPTPEAKLAHSGPDYARASREGSGGDDLTTAVFKMLPTPAARDHKSQTASPADYRRNSPPLIALLLPTPTATPYGNNQSPSPGAAVRPSLDSLFLLPTPTGALLPTPRATDGTKGGPNQRGSSGDLMLPSAVQTLLPTPTAADSKASGGSNPSNVTLTDAVVRSSLGDRTNPRFADGKPSPNDSPLPLQPSLLEEDSA